MEVEFLSAEIIKLENKCEALEARSHHNTTGTVAIPEDAGNFSSTAAVSALPKDTFDLQKWFNGVHCQPHEIPGVGLGPLHPAQLCVTYNSVKNEFKSSHE